MFSLDYRSGVPFLTLEMTTNNTELQRDLREFTGTRKFAAKKKMDVPFFWPLSDKCLHDVSASTRDIIMATPGVVDELTSQFVEKELIARRELAVSLPEDFFVYQPFEHQMFGLVVGAVTPVNGWIYDRGTGKTKMAIDMMRIKSIAADRRFRTLVVTPPVTIPGWFDEVKLHSRNTLKAGAYIGPKREKILKDMTIDVVFTSYETMRVSWKELALHGEFEYLIFDESHRLRGHNSAQSEAALGLSQGIYHKTIMTGSPMTNPLHLYMQLMVLDKGFIYEGNWSSYYSNFVVLSPKNRHMILGYKNLDQLGRRARSICIFKRKEECLDLPPKQWINVKVPLDVDSRAVYNSLASTFKATIPTTNAAIELPSENGALLVTALSQVSRGWLNQSNADPTICDLCPYLNECVENNIEPYTSRCHVVTKKPAPTTHKLSNSTPSAVQMALDLVSEILEEDPTNKIIVWFRANYTLHYTSHLLETNGTQHLKLYGGVDYGEILAGFNDVDGPRVLLAQIQCGIGWSAVIANYAIYVEPTLVPEHYEQSMDRNHRPGQVRKTTYYRILVDGTLDAGIYKGLEMGINIGAAVCDKNFCGRCVESGSCLLNLCDLPGISDCRLNSFIGRERLKIRRTI